ncbi:MAG: NHL domain-containing protein, partial [Frankiaceae bacterium]
MVGRVKRAPRRGMLAGSLVLAIMGAVGLVGATTALADTGYTISRYAGQANSAGGATPGPALSSRLGLVVADGLDSAGNLYIVDPQGSVIEKVTPGGTLSIFAGTGQNSVPIAGPATSSPLNNPAGVASDSAGNVYVADQNNHAVEKVAPDGTLSVFAGIPGVTGLPTAGPATSSHLDNPWAIATDAADNVYIADYGNKVVEKVTPTGQLSVIAGVPGSAGTPTAGPATSSHLTEAVGVAADSAGNVYIADAGPNVIAKVAPGGTLSIIAGISGTSAQPTPGLATASALSDPAGVGVDSAGAVYVADSGVHVIEKITAAGQLSVIAGSGSAGHPAYGGLATATSLDLPLAMVVDPAGKRLRRRRPQLHDRPADAPCSGFHRRPGDHRVPAGRPDAQHRRRQLGQ